MGEMQKTTETAEQLLERKLIQAEEIRVRIAKEEEISACVQKNFGERATAHHHMTVASGLLYRVLNQDFFGAEQSRYRDQMKAAETGLQHCEPDAQSRANTRMMEFRRAIKGPSK